MQSRWRVFAIYVVLFCNIVYWGYHRIKINRTKEMPDTNVLLMRARKSGSTSDFRNLFAACDHIDTLSGKGHRTRRIYTGLSLFSMTGTDDVPKATPELLHFLIENGADPNVRPQMVTVLAQSISSGIRANAIDVLLTSGARTDNIDELGSNALLIAVKPGRTDVVRLLLRRGGKDQQKPNKLGETAVSIAKKQRNRDLLALLVGKGQTQGHASGDKSTFKVSK